MQARVAIVLLNWNGRKHLETYLPSVLASTYAHLDIVLIDNGSTDDSVVFVQEHYPAIKVLKNEKNLGFAGGYNEGLRSVQADYYILLNTDVAVEPHWIEPMVTLLEANHSIAACQPKLLQDLQKDTFEYAGASGGWMDQWGYPFARGRILDACEQDKGQYDTAEPIFWASGAALFIRSSCFWEAGGFDPYFFAHQEEIDLCWRLQLLGYTIFACPEAVVYHLGGGTLPKGNPRKVYLNFRNNWIMLAKNLPAQQSILTLLIRGLLDTVSIVIKLLKGDWRYGTAVIQAHLGFYRWLFFHARNRLVVPHKNRHWNGYYKGSVLWQYYAKGRRRFSEIISKNK